MSTSLNPLSRTRGVTPAAGVFVLCSMMAATNVQLTGSGPAVTGSGSALLAASQTTTPDRDARDFEQPAPFLDADWTSRARSALTLMTLEYVVINRSPGQRSITATLLWDAGTTEGQTAVVDSFVVPAGQSVMRRVDPSRIPAAARGEHYPGLIQISLRAREGDTAVLPAFFVMPRQTGAFPPAAAWPFELMDADRLEAATRELSLPDQEGGAAVRLVEWRPSTTQPQER